MILLDEFYLIEGFTGIYRIVSESISDGKKTFFAKSFDVERNELQGKIIEIKPGSKLCHITDPPKIWYHSCERWERYL